MESAGKTLDIFFDAKCRFDGAHKFTNGVSRPVHRGLFATAEHDFNFHFMSAREKFFRLRLLEVKVVNIGAETNPNAFGFDFLLFTLRLLLFFSFGVEVFAVIEYLADGRRRFGRHFDEIELLFARPSDCLFRRHIFRDGAIGIDHKYKRNANVFIHARFRSLDYFWLRSSVSASTHTVNKNQETITKVQMNFKFLSLGYCLLVIQ